MGRDKKKLRVFREFASTTTNFKKQQDVDLTVLAVSDDALPEVVKRLPKTKSIVVHTSGSVPMKTLECFLNYGILYPLQTFTKERPVDLSKVPFCIEANSKENNAILNNIGSLLSCNVVQMNSDQRTSLHLSAVMASNFCNHLLALTETFCDEKKVPFHLLENLMKETIAKAFEIGPTEAQTGPAKRGDYKTLERHMENLKEQDLKDIYKKLTNSILKSHGKAKL